MLEIQETPLEEGQVIGDRYHLEAIIGEGGMGVVWAATDKRTKDGPHEQRALKFIRRDRTADARNEARLLREAKALSTIAHDNVARVFEVSELPDGTPFLVMERLVGETLKQRIARLERLPFEDCVRVARGIANGVRAAHAMGIVHRDLKPDNVFIENDGDVKVLDFGIAKELRSENVNNNGADHNSSLTTTGAMLGTLHYMAPEQVFGDTDVDDRADVWALGIVICECLSGKKPTEGSGSGQVLKAIMTKEFARLDTMVPGCPAAMADLVEAMLSRERDERPTMSEVLDHLSIDDWSTTDRKRISRPSAARFRARAATTLEATETTAKTSPPPVASRSSRLVWGAVIAVLVFSSLVLFSKIRSSSPTTPPTSAAPIVATPTQAVTSLTPAETASAPSPATTPVVPVPVVATTTATAARRPPATSAAKPSASASMSAAPPPPPPPPPPASAAPKPSSPPTLSTSRT